LSGWMKLFLGDVGVGAILAVFFARFSTSYDSEIRTK